MAFSSGLTQLDIIVIQITNLADRGETYLAHQPHFTRWKADLSVLAFFG
jgi:hypothetical protein